jgi:peroxiredoxin-like protein
MVGGVRLTPSEPPMLAFAFFNETPMHDFPHHYRCVATANASQSVVQVASDGLANLATDAPKEFGGPGDQWSPEALLVAAVADCFVLTFRAIAAPSRVTWHAIDCEATGTLERVDRTPQFTEIRLAIRISVPSDMEEERITRVLEKAEKSCLITNSLNATVHLDVEINRE